MFTIYTLDIGGGGGGGGGGEGLAGSSTRADNIVVPLGYHALVHAMRLMSQCTSVILVTHSTDTRGSRLLVEIHWQTQDTLNPTDGGGQQYMQSYHRAQTNGVGLYPCGR